MGYETPISVKELVEGIRDRKYFLPSIQREFVWGTDRIAMLFDSLMKGFPIGSFLFWEVPKDKIEDFSFYEFIRDFHALDNEVFHFLISCPDLQITLTDFNCAKDFANIQKTQSNADFRR